MAESKTAQTDANPAAKPAAKAAPKPTASADTQEKNFEQNKRTHKLSRWTVDACMKSAKRFDSLDAWRDGHPSSYKAATAKGWHKECCGHMTGKPAAKKAAKTPAAPKKKTGRAA